MPIDFAAVPPAPPAPPRGRKMKSEDLVRELAYAVLTLALNGDEITVDAVKRQRPKLAAAYTKAQSVIPTYLGQGRSADGLALHRTPTGKAWARCYENAARAVARLQALGVGDKEIAEYAGDYEWAELCEEIAALPKIVA